MTEHWARLVVATITQLILFGILYGFYYFFGPVPALCLLAVWITTGIDSVSDALKRK